MSLTNLEVNQISNSRPSSRLSQTSTVKSIPIDMENGYGRSSSPGFLHQEHDHHHNHIHHDHGHDFNEQRRHVTRNQGGNLQQYRRSDRGRSPSIFEVEEYESADKTAKFPVESDGKHIRFQTVIKKQEFETVTSHMH